VQPQVLRTYMLELRKLLGDDAGQPRFIQTLPKRGYRFVALVTERNLAPHGAVAGTEEQQPKAEAIIGRDEELAFLRTQLRQLAGGQRRVIFMTGEAGIGKTALVDAFSRSLQPSLEVRVARGQCLQGIGGKEEYYPVVEALCQLCAGADGEAACRVLANRAPAWLALGRKPNAATSPSMLPTAPERTIGDLCGALEDLAAEKPLILVFEDLHWADNATLDLISALARRRAPAQLLVIATCCPRKGAMNGALKGLEQDLLMRRLCVEKQIEPLRKPAVSGWLRRELEQESLPSGLADFVYRRSEGNPLFVTAVLAHLIAQEILVRAGINGTSHWEQREPWPEMDAGVPDQLSRMIDLEIERLNLDEQHLLEAASLMSVAFPAWAVAAALEKDIVETEEACDGLARRLHFVVRAGQDELPDGTTSAFYVFAHGLYREVFYQRQAAARRARRHIRIAERLAELFAGREADVAREMALHFEAAGDRARAARALDAAEPHTQRAGVC